MPGDQDKSGIINFLPIYHFPVQIRVTRFPGKCIVSQLSLRSAYFWQCLNAQCTFHGSTLCNIVTVEEWGGVTSRDTCRIVTGVIITRIAWHSNIRSMSDWFPFQDVSTNSNTRVTPSMIRTAGPVSAVSDYWGWRCNCLYYLLSWIRSISLYHCTSLPSHHITARPSIIIKHSPPHKTA